MIAAAAALAIVLTLVVVVVIAVVVRNTITRAYQTGYREAKSLYSTEQAQVWDNAAGDTLRWVSDGLPYDHKPVNPYKNGA